MLPQSILWNIAEDIPKNLSWVLMALSIVIPLLLWWAVASTGLVKPLFLPHPTQVWNAFQKLLGSGDLQKDIFFSLFRVVSGFGLAAIIAVCCWYINGDFCKC